MWRGYSHSNGDNSGVELVADDRLLYLPRDSDGDGLTDFLEEAIGSDPHKADTDGNGLRDNEDKNPGYRPHRLTDEEGIYQATVEALCQARYAGHRDLLMWQDRFPLTFGGASGPLCLRLPIGNAALSIQGAHGPVVCRPFAAGDTSEWMEGRKLFVPSHIDWNGVWHDSAERRSASGYTGDPFGERTVGGSVMEAVPAFRDYFPYTLSPDGSRARVGWEQEPSLLDSTEADYDIEVRKIDGRWYPISCRLVSASAKFFHQIAVLPDVPRQHIHSQSVERRHRSL